MRTERPFVRLTPRVRGKRWQYYVIAPLVLAVVGPFILVYRVFFGWWLNPILDWRMEKELRAEANIHLNFLFQDFDARFVANDRNKNETVVALEAADLRITVARHHGDYGISVAKRDSPENRESLTSILQVIYEKKGVPHKSIPSDLAGLGELFREKFNQVQTAVSNKQYSETVAAIDNNHRVGMQMMAQAFNTPGSYFEADIVSPSDLKKKSSQ